MNNLRYKNIGQKDRRSSSWSFREALIIRVWFFVWLFLMSWTPRKLNWWRLLLLRCFGAQVQGRPFISPSARIYVPFNFKILDGACLGPMTHVYSLGRVILHERCIISQDVFLCGGTHDFSLRNFPLMVGDVEIGVDAFVGIRAFVLPGVRVGDCAVVGAAAVVSKDVPNRAVVCGNPARQVGERHFKEET